MNVISCAESEDPEMLLNLAELYDDGAVSQEAKRARCEWDAEDCEAEGTAAVLNQPTPPTSPLREIHSNVRYRSASVGSYFGCTSLLSTGMKALCDCVGICDFVVVAGARFQSYVGYVPSNHL